MYNVCIRKEKGRNISAVGGMAKLTVDVQAIVSDLLLTSQRWVGGLTAQCGTVVLLLHRDADGTGDAERLPVVLLRHNTFARKERDKKKRSDTAQ